jgi:hypothetical protein
MSGSLLAAKMMQMRPNRVDELDWLKECMKIYVLDDEIEALKATLDLVADVSVREILIDIAYECSIIRKRETAQQSPLLQKNYQCDSCVCSVATTSLNIDRLRIFINLLSDSTLENVEFMAPIENENNTQAYKQMLMYLYFAGARLTVDQMKRARELEIFDILKGDCQSMVNVLPNDITELISKHL